MNATLEKPVHWVRDRVESLPCNVGKTEQRIRLIGGTALVAAAIAAPVSPAWRTVFALLGVGEIITGSTRFCPLWNSLGINTNTLEERARARSFDNQYEAMREREKNLAEAQF